MISNRQDNSENGAIVREWYWNPQEFAIFLKSPNMCPERLRDCRPGPYLLIGDDLLGIVDDELAPDRIGIRQASCESYNKCDPSCIERFKPVHLIFPSRRLSRNRRIASTSSICCLADERSGLNSTSFRNSTS